MAYAEEAQLAKACLDPECDIDYIPNIYHECIYAISNFIWIWWRKWRRDI